MTHRKWNSLLRAVGVLGLAVLGGALTPPGVAAQTLEELREMSLEELMDVQVTTVLRSAVASSRVPAAVYVVTAEDIRRSGATSLAEVLRLVPGMQVARVDAGKWSIGTRGFADRLSRSMLVLIDGRAVYSPLFGGTYWETQNVLLEDVERIEVVRGPGGTLWGSNAVNGIVSVVTRAAGETQGLYAHAAAGTEDRVIGAARYGAALGDFGHVRAYANGFDRESQFNTGDLEYDEWRLAQGGFRMDGALGDAHELTVQGDAYVARLGEFVRLTRFEDPFLEVETRDLPLSGGNLLARLSGPLGPLPSLQLQTYYDVTDREEYPLSEHRETFDVDVQSRHTPGVHDVVWGVGYRRTTADVSTAPIAMLPDGTENLYSAFLQDEISLAGDALRLTLGAKLEHNPYSGLEILPSGRLAWHVDADRTVWGSVTRAVRRPSVVEHSYATTSILDPSLPAYIRLSPNPAFRSEALVAYEAGVRAQAGADVYLTLAAFYNDWDDLLSTELTGDAFLEEPASGPPRLVFPVQFRNGLSGSSYGFELTADARPTAWWSVAGHYAFLRVTVSPDPGSTDLTQEAQYEGGSPRHQVRLRNSFDLADDWTLDWHLRYVSELPNPGIPGYATSDLRLAWRATDALELEIVGRNLHEPHHPEWPGENGGADVEIERSVYVGLSYRR